MATSEQWRWTDDQGVQRLLDVGELRAALADGRLQPTVLVWQRGMPSWVPAQDVPSLMDGLEWDEPTTDESLTAPHEVGRRTEPTPSIPPAMRPERQRFEQRAGSTMMGIGSGVTTPEPDIPKAAKTPKPDGGWQEGAARRDDEKTVTKVAPKKAKHPADRRVGPKAKTLPYSVTKEMGLGAGPKASPPVAPGPTRSGTTKIPPAVGSQEVLSDKFSGSDDDAPSPEPSRASSSDRGLRGRVGGSRNRAKTAKLEDLDLAQKIATKKAKLANAFEGVELGKGTPSPSPATVDASEGSGWTKPPPKRKKTLPKPAPKRSVPPPAPKRSSEAKQRPPARSIPPPGKKRSLPPPPKRSVPPAARAKASVPPPAKASVPPPAKASVSPPAPPARESVPPATSVGASPQEPQSAAPAGAGASTPPPVPKRGGSGAAGDGNSLPPPPGLPKLDDASPAPDETAGEAPVAAKSDAPDATSAEPDDSDAPVDAPPIEAAPLAEPVPVTAPVMAEPGGLAEPIIGHTGDEPPSGPLSIRTVKKASKDPRVLGAFAATAVFLGLLAFLVGRATAGSAEVIATVKSGLDAVPLYTRGATSDAKPSACLMLRAPARLAPEANHRVPFETRAIGEALFVGFARSSTLPGGLQVNPTLGTGKLVFAPEDEREDRLSRVVPLGADRFGETFTDDGGLRQGTFVAAEPPFVVAMKGDSLVRRPEDAEAQTLWSLPGDDAGDAISAVHHEGKGTVIAYRYAKQVFLGALDASGEVALAAEAVTGSGGKVGKPNVATDGREMAVVFADKPTAPGASIELRWGHGTWGEAITDASPVELPAGGPGGDAIAPAIAALPGRRWLLMWTEGKPGDRTLRAQTYDSNRRPVGAALRVSPATGSFGAGTIAVVDQSAVVLFLLSTRNGYEVWGTVLQCQ